MARPRSITPESKDLIALGKEMVEWVKKNKPIHIKEFYCIHKMILFKDWDAYTQKTEFLPYYETAMGLVSLNYINGTINPSIAQRFIRVYFKDVRLEEDAVKIKDHDLQKKLAEFVHTMRKEMTETVSDDVKAQFEALMTQISNMKSK